MDGASMKGGMGPWNAGGWGGVEANGGGRAPWGGCAPGVVNMQVAYF